MIVKRPILEDRELLCRRPVGRRHVMYQSWQKLLFLHWEIDPSEIQSRLPPGLFVDTFENRAYLGIVPFYMRNIRPRFLPAIPWVSNFLELNVRTYVHDADGIPGVWFFSLDTNQPVAAYCGRRFFHMPYTVATMSAEQDEDGGTHYQCLRKGHPTGDSATYRYEGISNPAIATPGSIDYFFAERYLLYAKNPKNSHLFSGRVYHKPYPLQEAVVSQFSRIPIKQAGFPEVAGDPVHAAFSEGVKVLAYPLERLLINS